jgi:pyruvate/2-oxoacid:ferredoxin oxidoreductase beta subunit
MDKYSLMVPNFLPCKEYFDIKKNNACAGCGISLAVRHVYKAIEGAIEKATWEAPAACDIFGKKSAVSIMKVKQDKAEVVICFDNEAGGKLEDAIAKKMPAVAVAQGYKYVATASPSYPFDLFDKVKKAIETEGKSYIHILCPCPVAWKFEPETTVKVGFKAVETLAFPLYEVGSGFYNITIKTMQPKKLAVYLAAQERFEKLTAKEIEQAAATVEKEYGKLVENVQAK